MAKIDIQLLSMFIGCQIISGHVEGKLIAIELPEYTGDDYRIQLFNNLTDIIELYPYTYDDVKPILRRITSLSTEEKQVIERLQMFCFDPTGSRVWMNTPISLAALIALRVDVFNWIDEGLAIESNGNH
jgi:hypothetical protein